MAICPNCNQPLRKNGFRNGIQRWKGHAHGCQPKGRSPIYDRPFTQVERDRRHRGSQPREVKYAIFDQSRLPSDCLGKIHKAAFVGVVVAPSRKQIERDRTGCVAIPFGQLSKKELEWIEKTVAKGRYSDD